MDDPDSESHQNKSQDHLPLKTIRDLSKISSKFANQHTNVQSSECENIPHHRFHIEEDAFIQKEDIFLSSLLNCGEPENIKETLSWLISDKCKITSEEEIIQ